MVETREAPSWGEEWVDANRRYWEAWASVVGQAQDPSDGSARGGWAESMEQWFKLMTPPMPPVSRELFGRLTEQARSFQQFGEQLSATLTQLGGSSQSTEDWQRSFRTMAEGWTAAFSAPPNGGLAAFWKLPFDTWSRTVSSASVFPGDFLESHKPDVWNQLAAGFQRDLERFLSVPALGYTREAQEEGQELIRLALEYQRALQAYAAAFRTLGPETLARLQHRLADRREPVTTLRALYDLWVDSSEEVYLELVATDAHAQAYGRMVNTLMALKNHGRNMVDEIVGALGLPTRHGLSTLQRRQQELRRELVALRRELGEAGSIRSELAELRREVQALRSQATGGGTPQTPRSKTIRKKPKEA
jgi:poly[(R)-3-hydroxyalkanoate] polymerase subunit PhaE